MAYEILPCQSRLMDTKSDGHPIAYAASASGSDGFWVRAVRDDPPRALEKVGSGMG